MRPIRFAHLSDTHFRLSYEPVRQTCPMLLTAVSPAQKLERCLHVLRGQALDFVLVTGDLVHEGDAEDYRGFRAALQAGLPGVRVIVSLGNHDRRRAFYMGYLGEERNGPYDTVEMVDGLRVIALDSGAAADENGGFSSAQMRWLCARLAAKAPRGTILHLHHPVRFLPKIEMKVDGAFFRMLRGSDVRAVFCGHVHSSATLMLGAVPEIVGDALAFASVYHEHAATTFEDRTGYHICRLDENGLAVFHHTLSPRGGALTQG